MKKLFVYGSLMNPEVFSRIIENDLQKQNATLKGHKRVKITGEDYPAIRQDPNNVCRGQIIFGLTTPNLNLLDHFEGEFYQRVTVSAMTDDNEVHRCETYIFKPHYSHLLSDEDWCNKTFRSNHMKNFIENYN